MKLIDTNIILYAAYPNYAYLRPLILDKNNFVSVVSMVEALGYHKLLPEEKNYLESVFSTLQVIELDMSIIFKAIDLKQKQKIELGDSLIASTALHFDLELFTRNISDFQKIPGLTVVNPI